VTNPPSAYGSRDASVPDTDTVRRPDGHSAGSRSPGQHSPGPQSTARAAASAHPGQRRVMGIQPVLFVGMCLLAIVTLITVVLIFVGDFESQAPRVVWTVVVFLAFTGLLALDLVLARRSATPLVIGVAANTYLLALLMITIWVRGGRSGGEVDDYDFGSGWLFAELLGIVLLTLLVVRAAAAGAWGLITLGKGSGTQFGRVLGLVAAGLLGLVGVLLTLHFAIDAFGFDVSEWYWRSTVAAIVVTALAASVTVLLFWNRRNLDWQEAEARGEHVRRSTAAAVPPPAQHWQMQQSPAPAVNPVDPQWPAGPAAPAAQWGGPMQAQPAPQPPQPQPGQGGLLPWPTHPDGTPYPMGPDGQPVFPPAGR
jgi:hypothetical protein